jgi:hypothetical protein
MRTRSHSAIGFSATATRCSSNAIANRLDGRSRRHRGGGRRGTSGE